MVEQSHNANEHIVVIRPNHSATWELNLRILIAMSIWSLLIALSFSLYGAWLILPFAGLELLALGAALYFVCRKLSLRQVIRIDATTVVVEKGFCYPIVRWRFVRDQARLAVQAQNHPWDAIALLMFSSSGTDVQITVLHETTSRVLPAPAAEAVTVGEFLNREESQQLLDILRGLAIPVRDYSVYSSQHF